MTAITYRQLELADCQPQLLAEFERRQEVKRCWRKEHKQWVLREFPYVEDWDAPRKRQESLNLAYCIKCGGAAVAAFRGAELLGFASVIHRLFGPKKQYILLDMLHVSLPYRNQGIGKELFRMACGEARRLGAKKLYISAHSSEESQAFYRAVGCQDAMKINRKLHRKEPCDRHLEFDLY